MVGLYVKPPSAFSVTVPWDGGVCSDATRFCPSGSLSSTPGALTTSVLSSFVAYKSSRGGPAGDSPLLILMKTRATLDATDPAMAWYSNSSPSCDAWLFGE